MAQVQKNDGAAPQEQTCTVKSGVQSIPLKLGAGKNVEQVRNTFKKVLNLSGDMQAYLRVPGADALLISGEDESTTMIPEGATLEFIKAAGQKG